VIGSFARNTGQTCCVFNTGSCMHGVLAGQFMLLQMQLRPVSLAQCGGKLQRTMSGKINTVFAHILRGLSGAKITRAKEEVFRNMSGGGCCVRCSYKADDGFLYPLDKAFFYVHKPPMCINHRWVTQGLGRQLPM